MLKTALKNILVLVALLGAIVFAEIETAMNDAPNITVKE